MDSLIVAFLHLPGFVSYGIIGAIAGVFGALVSSPFKSKGARRFIPILCAIAAINLARPYINELREQYGYIDVLHYLKEQRLFSVVIRYHPEAEDQLREGMKQIINTTPTDQTGAAAQQLSAQVINKFVQRHMIGASDQSLYRFLKFNADVLHSLQNRPTDCVGFFLGTSVNLNSIPSTIITQGSDLKADIIESAVNHPSVPSKASKLEDVAAPLIAEYQKHGYPVDDLGKIETFSTLSPSDGCRVATSFSDALASLGEAKATYVFKNLMLFGASEK